MQSQASGFGDVVRELKKRCGLDYVYCWHAMGGYWSGIMPEVRVVALVPLCHTSSAASRNFERFGLLARHVFVLF